MLKTTLTLMTLMLMAGVSALAGAPIEKGSTILDGTLFFKSQSGDLWENGDGDAFTTISFGNGGFSGFSEELSLTPAFGYFISDGLMLGGQFAWTRYAQGDDDLSIFAVGPTVGYYFNVSKERTEVKGSVYPYIRAFFNYGNFDSGDVKIWQYGGQGGILWMLSGAVALDAALQFKGDSWDLGGPDNVTGTTLMLGTGITAFIL